MTSQDLLTLARQGDSNAIAAILNRVTEPKGIKVKVTRQARCLHILLESDKLLNQQSVINFILGSIRTLKIEPIETVQVYGRQIGNNSVAWNQGIWLDGASHQPPGNQPPAVQPSISPISQPTQPLTPDPVIQSTPPSTASSPEPPLAVPESAETAIAASTPSASLAETTEETAPLADLPADTQALLRRPEAVVLILFVSLIMLWQLYVDFMEEANLDEPLSGRELARRLGVNSSTISRRKDRDDFPTWSQDLDPDGIKWIPQNGLFVAQIE
jgi:hypothetical protein